MTSDMRCFVIVMAVVVTLPGGTQPASAGPTPADIDARLSQTYAAIDRGLAASSMPGLVVGITDRHQLRKVFVHGYADLKAHAPLTSESRFAIGSISKAFTSIALLQLAQEGRF